MQQGFPRTEVLVIGAGLSGAITSQRLARAGIEVTCLEQGVWNPLESYPGDKPDFELQALGPWNANPNIRQGKADYPILDDTSDIKPLLFNGVGGSTVMFSAHWMRFLPSDFFTYSLDGVGTDWPIDYQDLEPYYLQTEADIGVSGVAGDPAYPDRPDYPMPPLPIQPWGEKVAAAHDRLGWHWWPGSNAITSRPYQGRRPCVQRSTCRAGCNEGAKGSTDRSIWPSAIEAGAKLVTGARVVRILTNQQGRAEGALFVDESGATRKIQADIVVLAAHAIGTARLLLKSADNAWSDGLANSSGVVGQNLMMHPMNRMVGFFDEPMSSWQGHWGQSIYSMEFAETRPEHDFVRGAKWNLSPTGGPLNAALYPIDGPQPVGKDLHDRVDKWLGRSALWGMVAEDMPDSRNFLALDSAHSDVDGDGLPRLHYKTTENSKRLLSFMAKRARESFSEAGAYEVAEQTLAAEIGWHPLGTCRMGNDPRSSVVDKWNRCHDISNLLIVDGSSFVTSSCVNPAATISAIAARATDHLINFRSEY